MTVYQEAHDKIDQLPEETVYLFIQLMDKMSTERKNTIKPAGKARFMETAGKIDIDSEAVTQLREVSMI